MVGPGPAIRRRADRAAGWRLVWALSAVVLLAFMLRAYRLDGQALWSDESISLQRSTQPVAQMLAEMPVEHAPLYFVVLNGWLRVAGTTDYALRFPSLWFGVLTAALLAALARTTFGGGSAMIAALLLAVSPLHVWYSQDARMYTMVTALGTAALWALVRALETDRLSAWIAYAVAAALALYTHYYAGLGLIVAAVFGLAALGLRWRRGPHDTRLFRHFLAAELAILTLFLPWLPRAIGVLGFPGWRPEMQIGEALRSFTVRFFLGTSVADDPGLVVALGCMLLLAIGTAAVGTDFASRRHVHGAVLVACGLGVGLLVLLGMLQWRADVHERYFLVLTPLLLLTVARGTDRMRSIHPRWLWLLALLYLSGASAWSLAHLYGDIAYAKPDYRDYTRHILASGSHDDALVLYGVVHWLTERYGGEDLPKIYNLLSTRNRDRSQAEIESLLSEIAGRHRFVWLAVQGRDPGYVADWLARHGYLVEGGWRIGLQLFRFAFPGPVGGPQGALGSATPGLGREGGQGHLRPDADRGRIRWVPLRGTHRRANRFASSPRHPLVPPDGGRPECRPHIL